jgi:GTP-binding protein EngB required for normal cell division
MNTSLNSTTDRNGKVAPKGDSLERLALIAEAFGAERVVADARSLAERIAEGRFFVACVGQFKRGKSTLLNALVGEAVVPTGVIPVTTVPTVIRYGQQSGARIQGPNRTWMPISLKDVEQYVSEEHNPENVKGITGVEVFVPAPLLASGMCFVDTPGLGSAFAANTAATQDFIPHIDAAIVVIGADPPISGEELAIVETVTKQVSDLLFVLNKADRVTEKERNAATAFARKLLESRLQRPVQHIYEISAMERLETRGPERDWRRLIADLKDLAENSGRSLTAAARDRGLLRITDQLLRIVHEERAALIRPLEESERRVNAMRTTIADAERSMRDLGYLLIAEQHRLSRTFADRRKEFLKAAVPKAHQELDAAIRAVRTRSGPGFRRAVMRNAQEIAKHYLMPWLGAEQRFAEQAFRDAVHRFVDMGNDFLRRLSEAGVPELADMPRPLDAEQGFRTRSRFYFYDFVELAQPASPLRFTADVVMGVAGAHSRIQRDAHEFLDHLLETNATRVQSDVDKRVGDSRSRLETDIRILLHEVSAVAERALKHARDAQAAGTSAVDVALARLDSVEHEIRGLRPAGREWIAPTS